MKLHVVAAVALIAAAAIAADLGKYADWPNTPIAYFMTPADRAQWSKVRDEAEAAAFVTSFVASRGPNFEAEVADRARAADDLLTVGSTPGSRTLRGRIVIVLGPPTSCSIVRRKKVLRLFGSKDFHPGKVSNIDVPHAGLDDMEMTSVTEYTLTYGKDEVIVIEVDPTTGKDRIRDGRMAHRVDALLAAAAAKAAR